MVHVLPGSLKKVLSFINYVITGKSLHPGFLIG